MPRDRILNGYASLPPEVLKELADLSDEVWASVAAEFSDDPDEIETAQIRLATIILDLAKNGQLSPLEITQTASRLMRRANVHMPGARPSSG